MPKFRVWFERQAMASIEVEADSKEHAEEIAPSTFAELTWEIQGKPELRDDITEEID